MSVIRAGQEGSINQSVNEVIVIEREPNAFVEGASTNIAGAVMQTTRGDLEEIHRVGSMEEFSAKLGDYDSSLDGYLFARRFFDAGGGILDVVRVTDGNEAAASGSLENAVASGTVFTILADSPGTWGNSMKVFVENNSATGYVNITVVYGKQTSTYSHVTSDSTDTDNYFPTVVQKDANAFIEVVANLTDGTLPDEGTTTLAGGTNGTLTGSSLADTAYVGTESGGVRTGIQKFKESDEVILVVSARSNDTVNAALRTHVADTDLSPRRTIISFAAATSVSTAVTNMGTINVDKTKVMFPHVIVRNPYSGIKETVSVVPYAAGLETLLSYEQSASQVQLPATVLAPEIKLTNTELATLTKNRMNPIAKVRGVGLIYTEDQTSSSNPAKQQQSTRKAKDFFALSIDSGLKPFISKPIRPSLWSDIKTAISSLLKLEERAGRIGRSDGSTPYSVKVDSSNNPSDVVQRNRVIVEVEISLLGHADKIYVYLDAGIDKTIVNA